MIGWHTCAVAYASEDLPKARARPASASRTEPPARQHAAVQDAQHG